MSAQEVMKTTLEKVCKLAERWHIPRPVYAHPWTMGMGGRPWTLATDGKILVGYAFPSSYPDVERLLDTDNGRYYHENFTRYFKAEPEGVEIAVERVKAWAGKPAWQVEVDCDTCDGAGRVDCDAKCGRGHHCDDCCDSPKCDGAEMPCEACSATPGRMLKFPKVFGLYKGKSFDCNYIACALEGVEGGKAVVALGEQGEMYLRGDDWRLVLMSMSVPYKAEKIDAGELVIA